MHDRFARRLAEWKFLVFEVGIFVLFLVTFGDYLLRKLWTVVGPLLSTLPPR